MGGEVYFEAAYEQNCLVNAMCVGLARRERLIRSAAAGVGNSLVLLGARTGRDGIGGASVLASAELSEEDAVEAARPCRSATRSRSRSWWSAASSCSTATLLASLQDLGAAGLSSSSSEMASKGEVGLDIDVSRVPLREADMEPFEIMISESQERMLCVVEPERLDEVLAAVRALGRARHGDRRGHRHRAGCACSTATSWSATCRSTRSWTTCPLYDLEPEEPADADVPGAAARGSTTARRRREALLALLGSPNVASKRFVFEQYDSIVGSRTVRRPESADAAVLVLEPDGGSGALAVSIDGNGRRVACDPYTGAVEAVLECARNLACVGAEPLGLTNCLNFGNPEKPHIAWQLTRAVEGLRDACLALGVPVVGGNVSLYNEGGEGPIYPTPIVGMVGKLPDPRRCRARRSRRRATRSRWWACSSRRWTDSELEKLRGRLASSLPPLDLAAHADALVRVRAAVRGGRAPHGARHLRGRPGRARWPSAASRGGIGARVRSRRRRGRVFGEGPAG